MPSGGGRQDISKGFLTWLRRLPVVAKWWEQAGHLTGLPYLAENVASCCQGWGQAGHLPGLLFTLQSTGDARKPYSRYPYLYSTTHLHLDRGGHNYLKKRENVKNN